MVTVRDCSWAITSWLISYTSFEGSNSNGSPHAMCRQPMSTLPCTKRTVQESNGRSRIFGLGPPASSPKKAASSGTRS